MAEHIVKRVLSTATNIASKSPKRVLTTDHAATTAKTSSTISMNDIPMSKTMVDLPGPNGYPLVGTAPEYFKGENKGQMHKVQVSDLILFSSYLPFTTIIELSIHRCFFLKAVIISFYDIVEACKYY